MGLAIGSQVVTIQRPSPLRGHTLKSNGDGTEPAVGWLLVFHFSFPFTRAAAGCDWRGQPAMDGRLKLARQEAAQVDPGRRARQRNQACVGASFLGSVFWTSKKWNSRCARRRWKNRSIDERETRTTAIRYVPRGQQVGYRIFRPIATWKSWWYCFVANQAVMLLFQPSATAPSTFLSTATKRHQSAALLHPAIAAFSTSMYINAAPIPRCRLQGWRS